MLDHMGEKQSFAEPIEWREQGEQQRKPARRKAQRLPSPYAAIIPGARPQPGEAERIENAARRERQADPWVQIPLIGDRPEITHRSHPFSRKAAEPWVMITIANSTASVRLMPARNRCGAPSLLSRLCSAPEARQA